MKGLKMKITFSLNQEFRDFLEGKSTRKYGDTKTLVERFMSKGHDTQVVHPNQIFFEGGLAKADHYAINGNELKLVSSGAPIGGDVFFVRGYSQDRPEHTLQFMHLMYPIGQQVHFPINNPRAVSFSYKPNQRELDLPWPPSFRVNNNRDLEYLLNQGRKIIAKPFLGIQGRGIHYLEGRNSAGFSDEQIKEYLFEEFVPAEFERRYVFLGGEVVLVRDMERPGAPGKEVFGKKTLVNPDPEQLVVAKKAMSLTGIEYGCVDFRGDYVLEVNGSGTGTFSDLLQPMILDYVERKVSGN